LPLSVLSNIQRCNRKGGIRLREKKMGIDQKLYDLKKEFDTPMSDELLDEIEFIDQTSGNISVAELLRPFTI
jgi:hypothetical protein